MNQYIVVIWKDRTVESLEREGKPISDIGKPEREHIIWCWNNEVFGILDKYKDRKVTVYEIGACLLDWS